MNEQLQLILSKNWVDVNYGDWLMVCEELNKCLQSQAACGKE